MEKWIDIKGFEQYYQVSDLGRVRSKDRHSKHKMGGLQFIKGRILKHAYYKNGYVFIAMCVNGVARQYMIHRIVAKHFVLNPNNYPDVNHKSGIKDDNRATELEWCTKSQNMHHAVDTGLMKSKGGDNSYARPVLLEKDGEKIRFNTQREAAKYLNTKEINIHAAKARNYLHKGYKITTA